MKVDKEKFKQEICAKCKKYHNGNKVIFGKCIADKSDICICANLRIFNNKEWGKLTGIKESEG